MAMLLDNNILSTHLKRPDLTFSKFVQHGGQICTSQIVVAELYTWCFKAANEVKRERRRASVVQLLADVPPLPFDDDCAWKFGELRARFRDDEAGSLDLMIAATAIIRDLTVVTNDRDFDIIKERLPDLHVIDWL
jgi:predicted nucleic acid-binding protein